MDKLDAKFYGQIRKAKDDSIVPDDEYMVFLAKDDCVPSMLAYYYTKCRLNGADREQLNAVERMISRVNHWRAMNPHRCKVPDAAGEKLLDQG